MSHAALGAEAWLQFRDPDGVFSVDLPSAPKTAHTAAHGGDGKPIEMHEYAVDHGGAALLIIVSDFSRFPKTRDTLAGAVQGAKKSAARDLAETPIRVDGRTGRDVKFIDSNGDHVEDQLFFVRKHLYQILYVLPPKASPATAADAQRFLTSFHFLGRPRSSR